MNGKEILEKILPKGGELKGAEPYSYQPYLHQEKALEALQSGKAIILRAPTGSGKTEAVLAPFLAMQGKDFPWQMIYSLPMRVLAFQLAQRAREAVEKCGFQKDKKDVVACHYGGNPESVLFSRDLIFTTIDQIVCAYACTPLLVGRRFGNIPAGAVASAFLVFDEIQLLDPKTGLQSAIILAEHSLKLGIPFAFLSATIPDCVICHLQKKANESGIKFELVEADEKALKEKNPSLKNRTRILRFEDAPLNADAVKKYLDGEKKVLVVVNTVDRAQKLYEELKNIKPKSVLIHSRFLQEHRRKKEEKITEKEGLGKDLTAPALVISTQVIEAGMDISADILLTELAPIDSLIQRAGRVARWGGEGEIVVFGVTENPPYKKELMEKTREVLKADLEKDKEIELNFEMEKEWVNKILNDFYNQYLTPEKEGGILYTLSKASFEGNASEAQKAVRGREFSVEVSICNKLNEEIEKAQNLESISVPISILEKELKDKKVKIRKFEWIREEYGQKPERKIKEASLNNIFPGDHIILPKEMAYYDDKIGLIIGRKGEQEFEPIEKERQISEFEPKEYKLESWVEHAKNTLKQFNELIKKEKYMLKKLCDAWGIKEDRFLTLARLAVLLHDLGKLNQEWQEKIGASRDEPLAHSDNPHIKNLPHHSAISAWAIVDLVKEMAKEFLGAERKKSIRKLASVLVLAVAHHHQPRVEECPPYNLIPNWKEVIKDALANNISLADWEGKIRANLDRSQFLDTERLYKMPDMKDSLSYSTYAWLAKLLRRADWQATGGEDAIHSFEKRYGNI